MKIPSKNVPPLLCNREDYVVFFILIYNREVKDNKNKQKLNYSIS